MHDTTISRLFFALQPPIALARRIVQGSAWLDASAMLAERLHVTMFILDDALRLDPVLVAAFRRVGGAVRAGPVAVSLDRLAASSRSIALRPSAANAGLRALYEEIARLAIGAGIAGRRGYRFGAHMTLGYRDGVPTSRRVAPIGWTADELVLIHSHVGRTRHEVLGRWPLVGEPDPQLSLL